ncbi:MAG: Chitin synthase, class 5 [Candelina mexicana]|nr:MAG: Chitin synthase, class 5 [Candelina mexicana]
MLISLTVGKVDAGVAVLLTEDNRLIEFPSILLPPNISSGSIVDITVARNQAKEAASQKAFASLQNEIYTTFGQQSPSPPVLRCRNATQTSVVLEWDPIQLATAEMRSLSLFRNGSKAGGIPRPTETLATKISGLAVDTEYVFHLVLRTSAGTYSSDKITIKTHKMTDLSGITVTPGVLPAPLRDSLQAAVERIGAKLVDTVRLDTTHFVCTEGRGQAWERAVETNIPVVRPEWVEGCEREGRIVGVRGYYLNADPRLRQVGQGVGLQRQDSQPSSPQVNQRPSSQASTSQRALPLHVQQGSRQDLASPPPPSTTETHNVTQSPSVATADGADETDRPPALPVKDHPSTVHLPEPKSATDEPKMRKEDRDQVAKVAQSTESISSGEGHQGAVTPTTMVSREDDGERTPEGAGSFTEVSL